MRGIYASGRFGDPAPRKTCRSRPVLAQDDESPPASSSCAASRSATAATRRARPGPEEDSCRRDERAAGTTGRDRRRRQGSRRRLSPVGVLPARPTRRAFAGVRGGMRTSAPARQRSMNSRPEGNRERMPGAPPRCRRRSRADSRRELETAERIAERAAGLSHVADRREAGSRQPHAASPRAHVPEDCGCGH
jgi:hypothetical protein